MGKEGALGFGSQRLPATQNTPLPPPTPQVDQFFGAHNQQLSDHVWLHSQSTGLRSPTLAKADRDWLNSQR